MTKSPRGGEVLYLLFLPLPDHGQPDGRNHEQRRHRIRHGGQGDRDGRDAFFTWCLWRELSLPD
jgi:hypothetical protein